MALRFRQSGDWGVKDPRACLFLDEWDKALGDKGAYLFVVRHWSSCIESLLNRHSREFAHTMTEDAVNSDLLSFWREPDLAAKMWLSYNKRILSFAQRHPDKVVIISQRALFSGASLIQALNQKFGLQLNQKAESPFDEGLLRDSASQRIVDSLSFSLRSQLDSLWQSLLAMADFKSENEEPNLLPSSTLEPTFYDAYQKTLRSLSSSDFANIETDKEKDKSFLWLQGLRDADATNVIEHLNGADKSVFHAEHHADWLEVIDQKFLLNGDVQLAAAKLLLKLEMYSLALDRFKTVIALGVYFPFIDLMMAQCVDALPEHSDNEADFFFRKALKANPRNVQFHVQYARFLSRSGLSGEAKEQLIESFESCGRLPANAMAFAELLDKDGDTQSALDEIQPFVLEGHKVALAFSNRLKLKVDYKEGEKDYLVLAKEKIIGKDKTLWLAQVCSGINTSSSEKDFIERCCNHWLGILKS